jgi:hypothetical protein
MNGRQSNGADLLLATPVFLSLKPVRRSRGWSAKDAP